MKNKRPVQLDLAGYRDGVLKGDRAVLGRALTLVESTRSQDRALAADLLNELLPHTGASHRLGITGVSGERRELSYELRVATYELQPANYKLRATPGALHTILCTTTSCEPRSTRYSPPANIPDTDGGGGGDDGDADGETATPAATATTPTATNNSLLDTRCALLHTGYWRLAIRHELRAVPSAVRGTSTSMCDVIC